MAENGTKDTFFSKKHSLNCRGKLLDISSPLVMGILNITPDSFHDGGRYIDPEQALGQAGRMISEGATILDIGAASSRPGAEVISTEEELARLTPVVSLIRKKFPETILSVDTWRAGVAKEMIRTQEMDMINDISSGAMDEGMIPLVASLKVPYIAMHMQGTPATMQIEPSYEHVTDEVIRFFSDRVRSLIEKGLNDILLDPGFGFGKTMEHNYQLIAELESFQIFGLPIVAGVSRKSFIQKMLKADSENVLNGTTALHMLLLQKGANILRVHDVKEAMEAITIFNAVNK